MNLLKVEIKTSCVVLDGAISLPARSARSAAKSGPEKIQAVAKDFLHKRGLPANVYVDRQVDLGDDVVGLTLKVRDQKACEVVAEATADLRNHLLETFRNGPICLAASEADSLSESAPVNRSLSKPALAEGPPAVGREGSTKSGRLLDASCKRAVIDMPVEVAEPTLDARDARNRSGDLVTEIPDSCDNKVPNVISTDNVERAAEPFVLEPISAASERQVIVESAELVELVALNPNQHAAYVLVLRDMREQEELSDLEIAECVRGSVVIRGGLWLLRQYRFGV